MVQRVVIFLGSGHNRLRSYTAIQAFFYLANGFAYLAAIDRLERSSVFRILNDLLGLEPWAWIMVAMGALFIGATLWPNLAASRALLSLSVGVKVLFGITLLASSWSPGGFSYLALAATDLLVAAAPVAPLPRHRPFHDEGTAVGVDV